MSNYVVNLLDGCNNFEYYTLDHLMKSFME